MSDDAAERIWAMPGAVSGGVRVWEWGLAYEDMAEWSDEDTADGFGPPVEYVRADRIAALEAENARKDEALRRLETACDR